MGGDPQTSVLAAPPPQFTPAEVSAIAAELFGVEGEATDLGSERDQTFLVAGPDGGRIVKLSNSGEDPATLDLEAAAIAHVARVDPALPVARLLASSSVDGPDGRHLVRLFERRPGRHGGPDLPDAALRHFGETHARLVRALRGFFHPAAGRELLYDVARAARLRPLVASIPGAGRRRLVTAVLDRFEERVAPRFAELPAQVVHGDLNLENVLFGDDGRISGILDFGDIAHSAPAADLAIAVASLVRGRPRDDVFRAARIAVDGYASRLPLEPLELELLGDLVAARLAAIVVISAWRVARYPENAAYIQNWDDDSWALLEQLAALGPERVARRARSARRDPRDAGAGAAAGRRRSGRC